MKRVWGMLLLLLALSGFGCVSHQQEITKAAAPHAPPAPPPPLTAGQVNGENAHTACQVLWDEMDRETQSEASNQTSVANPPSKK